MEFVANVIRSSLNFVNGLNAWAYTDYSDTNELYYILLLILW